MVEIQTALWWGQLLSRYGATLLATMLFATLGISLGRPLQSMALSRTPSLLPRRIFGLVTRRPWSALVNWARYAATSSFSMNNLRRCSCCKGIASLPPTATNHVIVILLTYWRSAASIVSTDLRYSLWHINRLISWFNPIIGLCTKFEIGLYLYFLFIHFRNPFQKYRGSENFQNGSNVTDHRPFGYNLSWVG